MFPTYHLDEYLPDLPLPADEAVRADLPSGDVGARWQRCTAWSPKR
jgi:hypothetical protein